MRVFAGKSYPWQGNYDLVGPDMPRFFDFVHAVEPEPHNEIRELPPRTTRRGTFAARRHEDHPGGTGDHLVAVVFVAASVALLATPAGS